VPTKTGDLAIAGPPAKAYNQLNAYFATAPGNYAQNLRKLYLLNTNYADLSFFFTILAGEKRNPHLDTEYLAVLETDNATPYFLNLHNGEVPHTLILGMTGSGKTYLITFKELDVVSLRVIAATVETHGEHLAFLRADGWLAALVLAENLKSGSSCWHRALWISQAGNMFGDIGTVKITLSCNGEKYAHLCKTIGPRGENNPCP
jgi:hypothetical protein